MGFETLLMSVDDYLACYHYFSNGVSGIETNEFVVWEINTENKKLIDLGFKSEWKVSERERANKESRGGDASGVVDSTPTIKFIKLSSVEEYRKRIGFYKNIRSYAAKNNFEDEHDLAGMCTKWLSGCRDTLPILNINTDNIKLIEKKIKIFSKYCGDQKTLRISGGNYYGLQKTKN
jgi:hypothetical protein